MSRAGSRPRDHPAKPGAHPAGFALLLTLSTAQFMMEEGSLRPVESPSAKSRVTVVRKLVTIRSAGAAATESRIRRSG